MNNKTQLNEKWRKFLLLAVLFAVVSILVLKYMTVAALWHDEAFSVLMIKYPFSEMFRRLALDVHPPFYYIAFRGWAAIFTSSVFSLRLFSLFCYLIFGLGLWLLLRRYFKFWQSYALLALTMLNPFLLSYAMEGRMYTLGLLLLVFAVYFMQRALEEKKYCFFLISGVFGGLAALTQYFLIFSLIGLFFYSLIKLIKAKAKKEYIFWLLGWLLTLLVFALWAKEFLSQLKMVEASYWIPKMKWYSPFSSLVNLLLNEKGNLNLSITPSFRNILILIWSYLTLFSSLFLLIRTIVLKKIRQKNSVTLFLFLFITPFALAIASGIKQSLYLDRYFVFATPFYVLLLGISLFNLPKRIWKIAFYLFLILSFLFSYCSFWKEKIKTPFPGMKGASDYIVQNLGERNKVLSDSSFVYFTAKYYLLGKTPVYLYTTGEVSHFSGNALLSPSDIKNNLNDLKPDEYFVISTTGFGGKAFVAPENWLLVSRKTFRDFNSVRGEIYVDEYMVGIGGGSSGFGILSMPML